MRRQRVLMLALVAGGGLIACHGNPAAPKDSLLAPGRWATENGACLTVTATICNLVVGCGHGQFPPPVVRVDGTFDVDGTYRIEVGPVSTNPAPAAHFSGSVTGSQLIVNVTPSGSLPPASYLMTPTSTGTCSAPCV
ncbi:MAG TPA: hypothetical protein VH138_05495 [Vicinamibacterales bacterium]|nr:hypothetical protein [Vicinamibacterales bacterium]